MDMLSNLTACVQQLATAREGGGTARPAQLKVQPPKTFNGNPYDMPNFESKFRSYAKLHKRDGPDACEVLYTYLEDGAARWYKTLSNSDTTDLETVFTKMRERFCPEGRRRLINQELFSMNQKEGETMENFIKRFETKAQLVNLTDESLISGFIRALRPDIQEWVMLSRPASLQAALETARLKYTTSRAIATTPKSKEINMVEEEPQVAAMRSAEYSEFFPNDSWRKPVDQLAKKSGKKKVTF